MKINKNDKFIVVKEKRSINIPKGTVITFYKKEYYPLIVLYSFKYDHHKVTLSAEFIDYLIDKKYLIKIREDE